MDQGKDRIKQMWRENCRYVAEVDDELSGKDVEIQRLQEIIQELQAAATSGEGRMPHAASIPVTLSETRPVDTIETRGARRGKAPPVDPFTGEDAETTLDGWLPSLQRAAEWNGWGENEKLMQLAGHLRGRARQEWDLLSETEKGSYFQAVRALHGKLEPVNKALAAQDFRHICQGNNESVADFIRRMEHTFKVAYGRDSMLQKTRNVLLHGQLQDGLRYEIMKAPAVSGAQTYSELCLASRNEEKRLLELTKRLQYQQTGAFKSHHARTPNTPSASTANKARDTQSPQDSPKGNNSESRKCYICGKAGHLQRNCRQRNQRQESNSQAGQPVDQGTNRSRTNMIRSRGE